MRTEPDIYRDDENDDRSHAAGIRLADWKESVGDVLECVDDQLAAYGFEIVMIDGQDDSYRWRIGRKP